MQGLDRNGIYRELVRDHLEEDVRLYWDEPVQQDSICNGLYHCGIYEKFFYTFGTVIRPLVHSKQSVEKLLSIKDPSEQREFYDNVWDTFLWRLLVRLYMGDVLIGRCPPFYQRSDMNIGEYFLQRMRHCMRDLPAHDNFYLEYVLTGEMKGLTSLPDYLRKENFKLIKSRIDKVHFLQGDLLLHMEAAARNGLHVADLSNIFDFIPEDQHEHYRRAVMKHVSPGARICHWTFVPMTADKLNLVNVPFAKNVNINQENCEAWNSQERAWFYQSFVLQEVGEMRKQENGHAGKNGYVITKAQVRNGNKHLKTHTNGNALTNGSANHSYVKQENHQLTCNGIS